MLIEYAFNIIHRAGVKHQASDALSKLRTSRVGNTELEDKIPVIVAPRVNDHNESKSVVLDRTKRRT